MITKFAIAYGLVYLSAVFVGIGLAVWFVFEHGANAETELLKFFCETVAICLGEI